jgi:hypothetical protein
MHGMKRHVLLLLLVDTAVWYNTYMNKVHTHSIHTLQCGHIHIQAVVDSNSTC